jgi:hypothetical protein
LIERPADGTTTVVANFVLGGAGASGAAVRSTRGRALLQVFGRGSALFVRAGTQVRPLFIGERYQVLVRAEDHRQTVVLVDRRGRVVATSSTDDDLELVLPGETTTERSTEYRAK